MTGAAVQWIGELLGLPDPAADAAALAETVHGAEGMYLVPAMVGLGAPYWDPVARRIITGMEHSHTRAPAGPVTFGRVSTDDGAGKDTRLCRRRAVYE